jgi:hypothetical protein
MELMSYQQEMRLQFVDQKWLKDLLLNRKNYIEKKLQLILTNKDHLAQHHISGLDRDTKTCAYLQYAAGEPLKEVARSFAKAAQAYYELVKLRIAKQGLPVLLKDPNLIYLWNVITPESHPEQYCPDHSLTNSRQSLKYLFAIMTVGQWDLAQDIAATIWDPEDASYIDTNSEVCTIADQELAYAMREYMEGNLNWAYQHLEQVRTIDWEIIFQAQMLSAILDELPEDLLAKLAEYLKYHQIQALRKENIHEKEYFMCMPAMGLAALAMSKGLVEIAQLPQTDPFFPIALFNQLRMDKLEPLW